MTEQEGARPSLGWGVATTLSLPAREEGFAHPRQEVHHVHIYVAMDQNIISCNYACQVNDLKKFFDHSASFAPYTLHFHLGALDREDNWPRGPAASIRQAGWWLTSCPWAKGVSLAECSCFRNPLQGLCPAGWGPAHQDGCEWECTQGCVSAGVSSGFPGALPMLLLCLHQLLLVRQKFRWFVSALLSPWVTAAGRCPRSKPWD